MRFLQISFTLFTLNLPRQLSVFLHDLQYVCVGEGTHVKAELPLPLVSAWVPGVGVVVKVIRFSVQKSL
jgi:hypothetical protein